MNEYPTLAEFSENLHTTFRLLRDGAEALELELISVTELTAAPRQQQFSLVFRGPETAPQRQGTYRLAHDRFGTLELFLVPIAKDRDGLQLEAIFTRLEQ
ncbi:MAG TPA: hypothetical protein VNQ79_11210 [Blastocatellia bacterium]|nr:hypothetical protein [Blastocatellia bacterium]